MSSSVSEAVIRQVADELGRYVYLLVDPQTGVPFYVGKGRGQRFTSHGHEADWIKAVEQSEESFENTDVEGGDAENERRMKAHRINEIRARGLEPQIWIVRHSMSSDRQYTDVEAALIDVLMSFPVTKTAAQYAPRFPLHEGDLTNRRRELSHSEGIRLLEDIITEFAAPPLKTDLPLLSITLGGWVAQEQVEILAGGRVREGYGYKHEWLNSSERDKHLEEIASSAAGWWRIDSGRPEREGINHVVVEHQGVSRALLEIKPGSWEGLKGERKSFDYSIISDGPLFDEIVGIHGHRMPRKKRGAQGIVRYWPNGIDTEAMA